MCQEADEKRSNARGMTGGGGSLPAEFYNSKQTKNLREEAKCL